MKQFKNHGGVPYTLVAVHQRVVLHQRENQRHGFLGERGMQIYKRAL